MSKIFSFNREFDFVRLDGLRRATGRPPHEWDIYSIKELVDNALDADEMLWRKDTEQHPLIHINIEYVPVPRFRSQQLFVEVSNRAVFPSDILQDIFDTMWYTSRKAFIKGLTRGALGNALKTLLGIPYALRNRVAGDWTPTLKPLSIRCEDKEFLPRYIVDALAQMVSVDYEIKPRKQLHGTLIRLGLDHFEQEKPRTREDIQVLAQQYRLCNPHAFFSWRVVINGEEWTKTYSPDPLWSNKFRGIAPVYWYSLTAFQDILGAIYRKKRSEADSEQISLDNIYNYFVLPGKVPSQNISRLLGQDSLSANDIEGLVAAKLHRLLLQHSPRFQTSQLGAIGAAHIQTMLTDVVPVEGEVLYASQASDDPDVPFVIEVAVASLKEGKRQVWTAINFSPTYGDPFQSRYLHTPLQPGESVLGLRGLLDAYELFEDIPVILFFHLISPNVEHHEFSKTEINHIPFKQAVGEVMDTLLTKLKQVQEEEELQLETTIEQTLEAILKEINQDERFVLEQLLEKLRTRLQSNPIYSLWLARPTTGVRLQTFIAAYLSRNTILAQSVARPTVGMATIPLHPDHHFFLPIEHISQDVLVKHHVNKILYIQERELEAVALENKWLSRTDMALLHNPQSADALPHVIVQCLLKTDLPILIWHNADEFGQAIVPQIRHWLDEHHLSMNRIIDLGLFAIPAQSHYLIAMMPSEQLMWLQRRFQELDIPIKALPRDDEIRKDISKRLEVAFFGRLMEHLKQEMIEFYTKLDQQLHITETIMEKGLDTSIKSRLLETVCVDSYNMVVEEVVEEFFKEMVQQHEIVIQQFMSQLHIKKYLEPEEA